MFNRTSRLQNGQLYGFVSTRNFGKSGTLNGLGYPDTPGVWLYFPGFPFCCSGHLWSVLRNFAPVAGQSTARGIFIFIARKPASMTHYSYQPKSRFRPCLGMLAAAVILLGSMLSPGCNWNIPRGEGFHDEMSSWSKNVRQQEKSDGTPLGTSNKALEIERNLGYR